MEKQTVPRDKTVSSIIDAIGMHDQLLFVK